MTSPRRATRSRHALSVPGFLAVRRVWMDTFQWCGAVCPSH
ncbi:hypothetical protein [Austwickia chelonae]|nr:hypothetical protein [Austwickia chelonae]